MFCSAAEVRYVAVLDGLPIEISVKRVYLYIQQAHEACLLPILDW